jgi:putative transposase
MSETCNALPLWHDERMVQLARALVGVASDVLRLTVSFLRSSSAIRAENLVLRRQLARYIERGIKPRRVDHATRVSLALFTRMFDWRTALVNVRPATLVRWHQLGWRIFWRRKCRAGRPVVFQNSANRHAAARS